MRRNPSPATRHIPRRCGSCKWWKLTTAEGGFCSSKQLEGVPAVAKFRLTRPDEGPFCGLWQPIQSEVKRADGTLPPDVMVGALQDTVHREIGVSRAARSVKVKKEER